MLAYSIEQTCKGGSILRNYTFSVFPDIFPGSSPNPFYRPRPQKAAAASEAELTPKTTPPPCPYQEPLPFYQSPTYPAPPGPEPPGLGPGPYQQPPYQYGPVFAPLAMRLAHAYVPWQRYNVVYGASEALERGTLFPELYMPQEQYGPCEGREPCGGVFHGC